MGLKHKVNRVIRAIPQVIDFPYRYLCEVRHGKFLSRLYETDNDTCVCLGNGPSLTDDIGELLRVKDADFFCVNHFADTPYYDEIRPTVCIFMDIYFWHEKSSPHFVEKRLRTFENMVKKTTWDMQVCIPSFADEAVVVDALKENKNIKIHKFVCAYTQNFDESLNHFLWKRRGFVPGGATVLNTAVFSAIKFGYKSVYIYGGDLSFHQGLEVDQQTNELYMTIGHVYGHEKMRVEPREWGAPRTMATEMVEMASRFVCFEFLASFAKKMGVSVYNGSSNSYLDCFPRQKVITTDKQKNSSISN